MNELDVKEIRKTLGLTQTKFAEMLGVSLITIQNWEKGRKIPSTKYKILCNLKKPERQYINTQKGSNIHYNTITAEQLDKALNEITEQRKMYAVQMEKAQNQIDKLISIIEKTK